MPLGLTLHGKWDGISMASPQLHTYKHERPAYSTPQPVENTPANNECRMVDLRGAKVASFFLGGDEFICLPQAFDLFLKHLVGGLHTVYTKLKRLSISPVVCNVEQVRILRGLGAIQPGVNRCKLITRKDFEILYQDCTQASRPGRPPKRYPMLPPTTDLMSHHAGMRSMAGHHGMLSPADISNIHKRMRLDQDAEKHLHQPHERMSGSPTKDGPALSGKELTLPQTSEVHANAANLYLQAQQALRQQYQQVAASGLQNGLDAQHMAAAAGINPALAPLMMMSHPGLFPGGLQPSSMNMLSHINQFAQNHGSMHQQAAAQAAAQVAAAAQSAAQASLAAAATGTSRGEEGNATGHDGKDSDCEEIHTPRSQNSLSQANSKLPNGTTSDDCLSPHSSLGSTLGGERLSDGSLSLHSDSGDSAKDNCEMNNPSRPASYHSGASHRLDGVENTPNSNQDIVILDNDYVTDGTDDPLAPNISSMQTLLTNIQGLLKVAADNARLQDKQCSFEIADLKTRMAKEKQIRGSMEKKLHESERIREAIQKRLKKERKVRKLLQDQLQTMQRQLGTENEPIPDKITKAPTTPITGALSAGRDSRDIRSPTNHMTSSTTSPSSSPNRTSSVPFSETGSASAAQTVVSTVLSPSSNAPIEESPSFLSQRRNSNSNNNGVLALSGGSKAMTLTSAPRSVNDQGISLDFAINSRKSTENTAALPDSNLYYNSGRFQNSVSQ